MTDTRFVFCFLRLLRRVLAGVLCAAISFSGVVAGPLPVTEHSPNRYFIAPRSNLGGARLATALKTVLEAVGRGQTPRPHEWQQLRNAFREYFSRPGLEIFYDQASHAVMVFDPDLPSEHPDHNIIYQAIGDDTYRSTQDFVVPLVGPFPHVQSADGEELIPGYRLRQLPTDERLVRTVHDSVDENLQAVLPTKYDIALGTKYHAGFGTTVMDFDLRPAREGDVQRLIDMPEELGRVLEVIALEALARGEVMFALPIAGSSSRMPPNQPPPEAQSLIARVHGEGTALSSKAAVPVGEMRTQDASGQISSQIVTYLGATLTDIRKLEEYVAQWAGRETIPNEVLIITNAEARKEHEAELEKHGYYGIKRYTWFEQKLGYQYYAMVKDTVAVKGKYKEPAEYEAALAHAQRVEKEIKDNPEVAVVLDEKAPRGHGDIEHQIYESGLLYNIAKSNIRVITGRNIENIAGRFGDRLFLRALGRKLVKDLAMQWEVSRRSPGQKGGAPTIRQDTMSVINIEDPGYEATWRYFEQEEMGKGMENPPELGSRRGYVRVPNAEALPIAKALFRKGDQEGPNRLTLMPYQMDEGGVITNEQDLEGAFEEREGSGDARRQLALFHHPETGDYVIVRKITSRAAASINNAYEISTPEYRISIYNPGLDRQGFIDWWEHATHQIKKERANAVRDGNRKVVDPKRLKRSSPVGVRIEDNRWEMMALASADAPIEALGTETAQAISREEFDKLTPEQQQAYMATKRFLATKGWGDPREADPAKRAETWFDNMSRNMAVVRNIMAGGPFTPDLPRSLNEMNLTLPEVRTMLAEFESPKVAAPPVAFGSNTRLLESQMEEFIKKGSLSAAGHIAGAIATIPTRPGYDVVGGMRLALGNFVLRPDWEEYFPLIVLGVVSGLERSTDAQWNAFFEALKDRPYAEHPLAQMLSNVQKPAIGDRQMKIELGGGKFQITAEDEPVGLPDAIIRLLATQPQLSGIRILIVSGSTRKGYLQILRFLAEYLVEAAMPHQSPLITKLRLETLERGLTDIHDRSPGEMLDAWKNSRAELAELVRAGERRITYTYRGYDPTYQLSGQDKIDEEESRQREWQRDDLGRRIVQIDNVLRKLIDAACDVIDKHKEAWYPEAQAFLEKIINTPVITDSELGRHVVKKVIPLLAQRRIVSPLVDVLMREPVQSLWYQTTVKALLNNGSRQAIEALKSRQRRFARASNQRIQMALVALDHWMVVREVLEAPQEAYPGLVEAMISLAQFANAGERAEIYDWLVKVYGYATGERAVGLRRILPRFLLRSEPLQKATEQALAAIRQLDGNL